MAFTTNSTKTSEPNINAGQRSNDEDLKLIAESDLVNFMTNNRVIYTWKRDETPEAMSDSDMHITALELDYYKFEQDPLGFREVDELMTEWKCVCFGVIFPVATPIPALEIDESNLVSNPLGASPSTRGALRVAVSGRMIDVFVRLNYVEEINSTTRELLLNAEGSSSITLSFLSESDTLSANLNLPKRDNNNGIESGDLLMLEVYFRARKTNSGDEWGADGPHYLSGVHIIEWPPSTSRIDIDV